MKIDRSKWEPCAECKPSCNSCENNPGDTITVQKSCANCVGYINYKPENRFCCECGRTLTEQAWKELERKVFDEV